jgi:hypothetical protein
VSPKRAKRKSAKKPARRAKPAKKAARRKSAKRVAPRRPAKKSARKPAKKSAPRRSAKKSAAKPAAKKSAAKRASKKTAGRPKLKVVARKAPAKPKPAAKTPAPKPFAGATAGASAKDLALFDLVRARVEVQAAIQGLMAGSAEAAIGDGKWNPRQIVLHLHYWDREMLPCVEPAWRENRRPPHTRQDILSENQESQGELGHHDWEEARRLMQTSREALLDALQSVPEEPAGMWSSDHALGWLIRILSHHDRHHAAAIKDARAGKPA